MVNHKDRKHALLSASGAARWINCPPSARLEEDIPSTTSSYAEEGTLAHEFGDLKLRIKSHVGSVAAGSQYRKWSDKVKKLRKNKLYTDDMEDHVEVYVEYVLSEYYAAVKDTPDAVLKIEERTDYSYLVPEGFGTSDANIIADGTLEIVDFKYGKGVKVGAKQNSQLRLYALGLLRKFELLYDIHTVKMTIVQPRLDHIESETLPVDELIKWAEETVKPAAEQAYKGEGDCNPGDWCRWCKVKPTCKALANHNLKLAKHDFAEPKTLTDEELITVYKQIQQLQDWAGSVADHVLKEALAGKHWPGYKVVEGKSNRRWADEQKAIKRILDFSDNIELDQVVNTKIKGIGEIEKLVGKEELNKMGLLVKPQGKPTLVLESDKRPALGSAESAKKDFDN